MQISKKDITASRKNWFKNWFDSEFYHKLYAHRNDKEAAVFANEIVHALQPERGASMLDLGCGNGRHAKCLASLGFNVTGLDLAFTSIQHAKRWEHELLRFYRHDMRDPFGENCFDYVFSFFTSFGYFKAEENARVLQNMARALKPNGVVVIDYANVTYSVNRLVPEEEKEIDGIIYTIRRWVDDECIHKEIEVDQVHAGGSFAFTESIMKFYKKDFYEMLEKEGLKVISLYGDYGLGEYDEEISPRLILVAQKMCLG